MKCKYMFSNDDINIHPFRMKSGYKPNVQSDSLQTYIDKTKLELTSIQVHEYYDNLCAIERDAILSLRKNENIVIKKADKNNTCVVMHKSDYIKEGERQLNTIYYTEINNFDLSQLQDEIHENVIEMHNEGWLDETTLQYLCDTKYHPKIGRLYLLPKIHKLDKQTFDLIKDNGFCTENIFPPCRPIISQNGSPTERISQYVDYFLTPIVNTHATYIRDSIDFILMMEGIALPDNCRLVSYDVTSMYTNVQFEELITAVEKAYSEFDKTNYKIPAPPAKHIAYLLRVVLENNVFEFNSKVYKQIIGCAMGSKCSPSVCDIRMYEITTEIVNKFPHRSNILYHGRYRDDGFIIYRGDEIEIHELFAIANSSHPLLKFTFDISKDQMNFLDSTVYKGARFLENNVLDIKTFIKPTNTYQYLDRNSAHHPSVFKGFIKGETIRYLRNTSDKKILSDMLSELKCNLIKRGYDENEVQDLINDVLNHCNRTDALNNSGKKEDNDIPLVLITAYNPCIRNLKSKLLKYWHILRRDEECKKVFSNMPIIAYRRHKNLSDMLTSAKIK